MLEDENAKVKRLLADAMLDNAVLKDLHDKKILTPAAKREAVARLVSAHEMSERLAAGPISSAAKLIVGASLAQLASAGAKDEFYRLRGHQQDA